MNNVLSSIQKEFPHLLKDVVDVFIGDASFKWKKFINLDFNDKNIVIYGNNDAIHYCKITMFERGQGNMELFSIKKYFECDINRDEFIKKQWEFEHFSLNLEETYCCFVKTDKNPPRITQLTFNGIIDKLSAGAKIMVHK